MKPKEQTSTKLKYISLLFYFSFIYEVYKLSIFYFSDCKAVMQTCLVLSVFSGTFMRKSYSFKRHWIISVSSKLIQNFI